MPPLWLQCGLVAAGGAAGAVFRFLTTRGLLAILPGYVGAGTLAVNVIGSFAIGLVLGIPGPRSAFSEDWRQFLVPGVLGGLTTFSALTYETTTYWHRSETIWLGVVHLGANLVFGLSAVALGNVLGRALPG